MAHLTVNREPSDHGHHHTDLVLNQWKMIIIKCRITNYKFWGMSNKLKIYKIKKTFKIN